MYVSVVIQPSCTVRRSETITTVTVFACSRKYSDLCLASYTGLVFVHNHSILAQQVKLTVNTEYKSA